MLPKKKGKSPLDQQQLIMNGLVLITVVIERPDVKF